MRKVLFCSKQTGKTKAEYVWEAMDGKSFYSAEKCEAYEEHLIEKTYINNFPQVEEIDGRKHWYYVVAHNDMKSIIKVMRYQYPNINEVNLHDLATSYPQWICCERDAYIHGVQLKISSMSSEIDDLQKRLKFLNGIQDQIKIYEE